MTSESQKSPSKNFNNPTKITPFRPISKVFARICKTTNYAIHYKSVIYECVLRFCILQFQKIDDYVATIAIIGLSIGAKRCIR